MPCDPGRATPGNPTFETSVKSNAVAYTDRHARFPSIIEIGPYKVSWTEGRMEQQAETGFHMNLCGYLFREYLHLLTPAERHGWDSLIQLDKAAITRGQVVADLRLSEIHLRAAEEARQEAIEADPLMKLLLDRGRDAFRWAVTLRLLRDNRDDIIINLCPKCFALCKTPRAKQCPECFHSWHEAANRPNRHG